MEQRKHLGTILVVSAIAAMATPVEAQGPDDPPVVVVVDPNAGAQPMVLPPPVVEDGMRFRYGVGAALGAEFVDLANYGSAFMVGFDLRLGLQINDMFGVYLAPHLSFGSFGGILGMTGTTALTAVADVTLRDRVSIGAGFGWGVLNNPSGPTLHIRAAAYPLVGRDPGTPRRRGLALGFDLRTVFADGVTGTLFLGTIGFERF